METENAEKKAEREAKAAAAAKERAEAQAAMAELTKMNEQVLEETR